jgi:hypothetical protein
VGNSYTGRVRRPTLVLVALGSAFLIANAAAGCGSSTKQSPANTRPVRGQLVGVMFDGPVFAPGVNLERQLDQAVASGVESLRVAVDWSTIQPVRSPAQLPSAVRSQFVGVGGIPTRFGLLDRLLTAAARRELSLLPVVEYTPRWAATRPSNPASPPRSDAAYGAFLTALVRRYGPRGSFWVAHPRLHAMPVRMWQIWNEPHFTSYWTRQPFAQSYVRLLAAAHAAIKAIDPQAKVVLGGLADLSWDYLTQIYQVPGARRLFDVVAIHPYTAQPQGVITILDRVRAVMDRFGDAAKPILATEITWPSSEGKAPPQFGVSTTERQQALRLAKVIPLLISRQHKLGLMGFYWYTWMGNETPGHPAYAFDYAGLLKYVNGAISAKPALAAFKRGALSLEGCRRKASAAACAT